MKKRIIFYRIGAIGDIMHCLPLLKLVRGRQPQASIEILVGSDHLSELLQAACPYIDRVWTISHQGAFNKVFRGAASADEQELIESLREYPADEFIYLHSSWLKAQYLNLFFLKALKLKVYKRDDELSAVANFVTSYDEDLKFRLLRNPFGTLESKTLELGSVSDANYICVVPGVGKLRPDRAYPLSKWVDFIKLVLDTSDYEIKILGGPDEKDLSSQLDEMISSDRVENLIGETTLLEMARILNSSQHVYSADTGTLHIAAALARPLTALFAITSEKRFGPFSPGAEILRSKSCQCQTSNTNFPKHCEHIKDGYASCVWDLAISNNAQKSLR